MTWEGTDEESTIHDYMIALSSTSAGSGDIMPFTSSHGHQYFITYHPNLVDFEEFYVHVRARNKAGLEVTSVSTSILPVFRILIPLQLVYWYWFITSQQEVMILGVFICQCECLLDFIHDSAKINKRILKVARVLGHVKRN